MDGTIRSGVGSAGMITLPLSVDAPLLVQGDSFDVLDNLPAESIDVCITDPPAGISFMKTTARTWDSFAGYVPRTEQGRDIAARLGKDDLVRRAANLLLGLSLSTATEGLPARDEAADLAALFRARSLAPAPLAPWAIGFVAFSVDIWTKVARVLKPGAFVVSWALPKTADLQALAMRCVGWTVSESCLHIFGGGMPKGKNISKAIDAMAGAERDVIGTAADFARDGHARVSNGSHAKPHSQQGDHRFGDRWDAEVTAPATDDARRWDGWNTQLAPGWEQYLIADTGRAGTYADQVLTHGTGAMHVDACRIARGEDTSRPNGKARGVYGDYNEGGMSASNPGGSWPRNVVLTHAAECDPGSCANGCPAGELDRQTGEQRDGVAVKRNGVRNDSTVAFAGPLPVGTPDQTYAGGGGASRFFTNLGYFPKAHARGAGIRVDITNRHPTIKNPDLTEWLTRLFAATSETTGGLPAVVLDPFAGSFTGAIAAIRSRVRFVGITLDAADVEVGRSRVAAAVGDPQAAIEANTLAPVGAQLSMI
jgi:DNA modification methylase